MKVVHVSYYYDERLTRQEELVQQHATIRGWAEALRRGGAEVTVINRFSRSGSFQLNGVQYHFIKDGLGGQFRGWQIPFKFLKQVSRLDADIIHLHHLSLSLQTFILRLLLRKKKAIVIQHHGGPFPAKMKRRIHHFFNRVADGFFFTTVEQGMEWFQKKNSGPKLFPVMEGAGFLSDAGERIEKESALQTKSTAKKITGLSGDPCFLWVGRLDPNKDPLTVLGGLELLFEKYPAAGLHMIYNNETLLDGIKKKIDASVILRDRVHLKGKMAHTEMRHYYHSADYFVLGSHYEGSGYALSEALQWGCVPIVTDIPSFRMMTDRGRLGALWKPGDKNSFLKALTFAIEKPLKEEAGRCIDFFRDHLSFDAIAQTALLHYNKIISRRRK